MGWLKSIFSFLAALLNFSKWFTERKDARTEKANKVEAVKHSDATGDVIRAHYDKYRK